MLINGLWLIVWVESCLLLACWLCLAWIKGILCCVVAVVGNRAVGSLEAEFWQIRGEVGDYRFREGGGKDGRGGVTLEEEEDIVRGGEGGKNLVG